METRLTKAALLVFLLSAIVKEYMTLTSVNVSISEKYDSRPQMFVDCNVCETDCVGLKCRSCSNVHQSNLAVDCDYSQAEMCGRHEMCTARAECQIDGTWVWNKGCVPYARVNVTLRDNWSCVGVPPVCELYCDREDACNTCLNYTLPAKCPTRMRCKSCSDVTGTEQECDAQGTTKMCAVGEICTTRAECQADGLWMWNKGCFSTAGANQTDWDKNLACRGDPKVCDYKCSTKSVEEHSTESCNAASAVVVGPPGKCPRLCHNVSSTTATDYTGKQHRTFSNKTCQRWDSQTPHKHTYDLNSGGLAENFCRSPDNVARLPWCYTTDPNKTWEFCDISFCHGCKDTKIGQDYTGTVSWAEVEIPAVDASDLGEGLEGVEDEEDDDTRTNKPCLRWDSVTHDYTTANFSGAIPNLSQAENYCRNPDNDKNGPWCFVKNATGKMRKTCYVPYCDVCLDAHGNYGGRKSTTKSGWTCQRWDTPFLLRYNITDPSKFMTPYKYGHLNEVENHCRRYKGDFRQQPWCYITTNDLYYDVCDVRKCTALETTG